MNADQDCPGPVIPRPEAAGPLGDRLIMTLEMKGIVIDTGPSKALSGIHPAVEREDEVPLLGRETG